MSGGEEPRGTSIRVELTLAFALAFLPLAAFAAFAIWGESEFDPGSAWLLPVLLWAAALILVWVAVERRVARPLRQLSSGAKAYGAGESPPALPSGTAEFQSLTESLREMGARIERRESELTDALAHRDAMVREIHHRVKNNMQIVTSLVNLQAKTVQGDVAKQAFADIQTRVRALALVHRYLYESDDLKSVNLGAFLQELAASLQLSLGISQDQIKIEVEAEPIWDVSDRAVPLALFMTEAMTNALRHAFPQGRPGRIRIVLKRLSEERVSFSVEDNGVGLTTDTRPATLGMSLINAFARQVDGKLTISGPPGTIVLLEFAKRYEPDTGAIEDRPA